MYRKIRSAKYLAKHFKMGNFKWMLENISDIDFERQQEEEETKETEQEGTDKEQETHVVITPKGKAVKRKSSGTEQTPGRGRKSRKTKP